jgi:large subunit ribosomal protein L15
MKLNKLIKITKKTKRRLGQGHGSGRVKTSGRGTKGQKARYKIPLYFEGGALPLTKRLPFLRGKGKNASFRPKPIPVNLDKLSTFKKGCIVDIKALVSEKIVGEKEAKVRGVKILGRGKIENALTIKVAISKKAQEKIKKAGGEIIA